MSKFPENAQFRISAEFSKRLKLIMYDNDCSSNKQFAELVGVSEPVIAKAVNFGIVPATRTLIKIADGLQLSLSYLLALSNEKDFERSKLPLNFCARLESLIQEKKINYGQLATQMSFPRTYFYEWIKEGTLPTLDYLLEIAEYFNVSLDYLLGRTDF